MSLLSVLQLIERERDHEHEHDYGYIPRCMHAYTYTIYVYSIYIHKFQIPS